MTTSITTDKKLKQYANNIRLIDSIKNKINVIDINLQKIRTIKYDDIKSSQDSYIIEQLIDDKIQLQMDLQSLYISQDIMINALSMLTPIHCNVLIDYYCNNLSTIQLAIKYKYSDRQIRRIKDSAIKQLSNYV